jgi:hypothetical protein
MELNLNMKLFSQISELNSPEYIFNKFNTNENLNLISYEDCKNSFYFCFGSKIKKKEIKNIINIKNRGGEGELYCNLITLEEFKFLFFHFKLKSQNINDHEIILSFYYYLKGIDKDELNGINLKNFKEKIKYCFPNLNDSYIEEIFLLINKDKDGLIKLCDIEKYLI